MLQDTLKLNKMIKVSEDTKKKLTNLKIVKRETYDEIINRLIKK